MIVILANERQALFNRGATLGIKRNGLTLAVSAIAATFLVGMTMPATAQDVVKSPKKWRPKDGAYTIVGEGDRCERPAFGVRLRKKVMFDNQSFYCTVTRLTDVAEGAIRLDLSCHEPQLDPDDDPKHAWKHKEIMKLRKIDEKSFFMLMTNNGKFSSPEWRVRYCGKAPEIR